MTKIKNKILLFLIRNLTIRKAILFCMAFMISSVVSAVDTTLKIQYDFGSSTASDSITDVSGNGYNAKLLNGATVKKLGRYSVLDMGALNGYLNMGAKTGGVIKTLTNFSISLFVYVDPSVNITAAGNFICTFANSADMNNTANGNMFLTALNTRYAISKTNWSGETSVSQATALTKGSWQHITYTQSGTTGTMYVNGVAVKTGTVSTKPSDLGATTNNYLAKSCYSSDAYLMKSMMNDFRLYNRALGSSEVLTLASQKAGLDSALYVQQISDAKTALQLTGLDAVISNLTLPTDGGNSVVISWSSSNPGIISNTGVVTRPATGGSTVVVKLTATITKNGITDTKEFSASVIPYLSDRNAVIKDSTSLTLSGNLTLLRNNLALPASGAEGSSISWSSDTPATLSNTGIILSRPAKGSGSKRVLLTATISRGAESTTKTFEVLIAETEDFSAYLFAYFTGNNIAQEAIRFAISDDAYTYKALNSNNPVVSSAAISSTGGVRDPHILRGDTDNSYYMVATDMVSALGWNSNRAMVLLKSTDLINWQSAVVNIPNTYSQFSAADRVWAPQTIYDPTVKKYMVYFAMRLGSSDYDKIYYAYANSSFTALESAPQLLFDNSGLSTIDPDIILKDGVYNLFFKTEANGNGIKKAVSTTLTGGYTLIDKYLQSTTNAVEGSGVFKLINSDNYILMYDMYTSGSYQFTISTDLLNFSVAPTPISFDFTPRHGTIIPITASEKQALMNKWNPVSEIRNSYQPTNIGVFPNPAKDVLNLSMKGLASKLNISVTDLSGKEMMHQIVSENNPRINISILPPGIYLLHSNSSDGITYHSKFIVR